MLYLSLYYTQYSLHADLYVLPYIHNYTHSVQHTHCIVIYVLYYTTHVTTRMLCIWCCTQFNIHISLYALDYTFYAISVYTHIHSKLCTPCYTIISLSIYIPRSLQSTQSSNFSAHTPCFTFLTFTANVKYDTALHCAALYYTTPHYTHGVHMLDCTNHTSDTRLLCNAHTLHYTIHCRPVST